MNNKNKKIIIISIVLGILVLTIGLTYAMFTISKYSSNSKLIAGDIYMHYKEASQGIKLENAIPSETYDATSFFEFTIDGKNTYLKKDIYYEIVLAYGDEIQNKARIKDNLLKFRLTEVINNEETELFTDRSFSDLTNKRIWVETIPKGTNNEILKRYRLYMWLSNDTIICGGDETENCDYYIDKEPYWENVYASIKVDVAGDFNEKSIATDESCFTIGTTKVYQVNSNMTTDELNKCTTYVTDWEWLDGETPEAFCKGTGTNWNGTFQEKLDNNGFTSEQLFYFESNNIVISTTGEVAITDYDVSCGTDVIIPKTIKGYPVTVIGNSETNIAEQLSNKVNSYKFNDLNNYGSSVDINLMSSGGDLVGAFEGKGLTSVVIPDSIKIICDRAFLYSQLTNVEISNNVRTIGAYAFGGNKLTSVIIPDSVVAIGWSAFKGNQLTNIVIPDSVVAIGSSAFSDNQLTSISIPNSISTIGSYAFANNQLTSAKISNGVKTIDEYAFANNQLVSIDIPDSVITIGPYAFDNNQLTSVEISNVVKTIDDYAFANNRLVSIVIPNSVTTIGYDAFQNNQLTSIAVGNGIQYINRDAFFKDASSNPNLSKITINKSCANIKNIPGSSTDSGEYYPWLSGISPYTSSGVTIYGSNNEVCDTY